MIVKHIYFAVIISSLIISCSQQENDEHSETISSSTILIDDDFNRFLDEFSADYQFQLNRIKFPLKTNTFDINQDKSIVTFQQKSKFKQLDFREMKSKTEFDNWNQNRVVDVKKLDAVVEFRGVDNGINIDFIFKKINNTWMLIEINDSSM
jgi:hypothetical protein